LRLAVTAATARLLAGSTTSLGGVLGGGCCAEERVRLAGEEAPSAGGVLGSLVRCLFLFFVGELGGDGVSGAEAAEAASLCSNGWLPLGTSGDGGTAGASNK